MKPWQRLRSRRDFAAVYQGGRRTGDRLLTVRVRPNGLEFTRFGFVCGKAIGKAVVRNRVKRRLREAVRLLPWRGGYDIVVSARPGAGSVPFSELRDSIEQSARRLRLLREEGG